MGQTLITTKKEFGGSIHTSFLYGALEYHIMKNPKDWRFDLSDQVYILNADKDEINPRIKESYEVWITCTPRQNKYINIIRLIILNIKKSLYNKFH